MGYKLLSYNSLYNINTVYSKKVKFLMNMAIVSIYKVCILMFNQN